MKFNRSPDETPIVSPEEREGSPKKGIQRRESKSELFEEVPTVKKAQVPPALPFDSAAFAEAWEDWQQHRTEKRKPITPLSAKKALADLAKMGEPRAIAAINHSIANGYQGIYEPDAPRIPTPAPTGDVTINGRVFKS